jgi:hypothetical protein
MVLFVKPYHYALGRGVVNARDKPRKAEAGAVRAVGTTNLMINIHGVETSTFFIRPLLDQLSSKFKRGYTFDLAKTPLFKKFQVVTRTSYQNVSPLTL